MGKASRIRHSGKVFRDPIHGLIRIDKSDELILDLIDTPEFQRLRRVRQLGVSFLTYHGAEHSRFAHSLGVFATAQDILAVLIQRYRDTEAEEYLQKHALLTKVAALLHDLGHGPFSHVSERAFSANKAHELKTVQLITDPEGAISPLLIDAGIAPEEAAALISHASTHTLLTDIVSSQLDADRMDYLLRDSHSTGVKYGEFDRDWIINTFCIGVDRSINSEIAEQNWRLCLDSKRGEDAAEQFILARAHMNEQVYFHRVTRGFEVILLKLLQHARRLASEELLEKNIPDIVSKYVRVGASEFSRDDWLQLDEANLMSSFHAWSRSSDASLSRLASAIINRNCILSSAQAPTGNRAVGFFRNSERLGLVEIDWEIDDINSSIYKGMSYSAKAGGDEEQVAAESIFLSSGHLKEAAKPLEASSKLMSFLEHENSKLSRLFFDKAKSEIVARALEGKG